MSTNLALAPEPPPKAPPRAPVTVRQIIVHQLMSVAELKAWIGDAVSEYGIRMKVSRARRGKDKNPIPFYQFGGKGGQLLFDYDEIKDWMRGGRS
jgi:hypothetical protein